MLLSRVKLNVELGFDVHVFAKINAVINSIVTVLLVLALISVKLGNYKLHRNVMLAAMFLSILFLLSYISHHLLAGDTRFGDVNHDGILSEMEKQTAGTSRIIYYFILGTHIPLAGIVLPFILFTAYRGLTGEFRKHKKLARITWPLWFYVAVTGVVVYIMISPYY
jgi:putative membrane protein